MPTTSPDGRRAGVRDLERDAARAAYPRMPSRLHRMQMQLADLEARIVQLERPAATVPPFIALGSALESALARLGEAVAAAHAPAE
jgi:hypothetical protein